MNDRLDMSVGPRDRAAVIPIADRRRVERGVELGGVVETLHAPSVDRPVFGRALSQPDRVQDDGVRAVTEREATGNAVGR